MVDSEGDSIEQDFAYRGLLAVCYSTTLYSPEGSDLSDRLQNILKESDSKFTGKILTDLASCQGGDRAATPASGGAAGSAAGKAENFDSE
ncbi:MAG: hypothetical protein P0S96_06285 [Simkaniaceae bacterium]|nr:hypothetical protein [Candidatus Sacchlamyda saccharinae]